MFDKFVDLNHTDEYCSLKQIEQQFKLWADHQSGVLEIAGDCASAFSTGHIRPNILYDRRINWRHNGRLPQYVGICYIKCGGGDDFLFHSYQWLDLDALHLYP